MIYRIIRLSLKAGERTFQILHDFWLRLPKVFSRKSFYKFVSLSSRNAQLIKFLHGSVESQYLPEIYGLSNGGSYSHQAFDRSLWMIENVSFSYRSNFIRFADGTTYNCKFHPPDHFFNSLADLDLVDHTSNSANLVVPPQAVYLNEVLHLTGVNSNNWAHFLAEYFSKLYFIDEVSRLSLSLDIVLFDGVDDHIKRMVEDVICPYSNIQIVILPPNVLVHARTLYYINNDSYVGDLGRISTLTHIRLSDSCIRYALQYAASAIKNLGSDCPCKIFIGRKGARSLANYDQVLKIFESYGFVEVFPHELTFSEKVKLFSGATFIAGPLSSGFANVIFSPNIQIALVLTNCSRHDDTYISKIAHHVGFRCIHLIGDQNHPRDPNSDYNIQVDALESLLDSLHSKV